MQLELFDREQFRRQSSESTARQPHAIQKSPVFQPPAPLPTPAEARELAALVSQLEESKFVRLFRHIIDSNASLPRPGFDNGRPAVPLDLPDAELYFKFAASVSSWGHHSAAWMFQIAHAPAFLTSGEFAHTLFTDHLKRAFANLKQMSPNLQHWRPGPDYLAAFDSASEGCEQYYLFTNMCVNLDERPLETFSETAHRLYSEIVGIPEDRHPAFGVGTPETLMEGAAGETKQFIVDLLNIPSSYYFIAREGRVSVAAMTEHGAFLTSSESSNRSSTVGLSAVATSRLQRPDESWFAALPELEALINDKKVREQKLQRFFVSHPEFLFALDERYCEIRPHVCLFDGKGDRLVPDFMARIQDSNIWNMIELKLPTSPVIVCSQTLEKASAIASRGIAELLSYRDFFSTRGNRNRVMDRFGTAPYEPCLVLIIGRGRATHRYEWSSTRCGFPNVDIVSYDYLFERAQKCAAALRTKTSE